MDQPERLTRKFTISRNQRQSFLYLISFNNTKTKNPSFDKKTSVKEQKNKSGASQERILKPEV